MMFFRAACRSGRFPRLLLNDEEEPEDPAQRMEETEVQTAKPYDRKTHGTRRVRGATANEDPHGADQTHADDDPSHHSEDYRQRA